MTFKSPVPLLEPGSMMSSDAAKWYRKHVQQLPALIGEREPAELLLEAWRLKSILRLNAALSLVDPDLHHEFLRSFTVPSIEELEAFVEQAGGLDNRSALRKGLEWLTTISLEESRTFPGTVGESIGLEVWDGKQNQVMTEQGWAVKKERGFPQGFMVHTKEGLKRIEQVKAGDLVLSSPEDGSAKLEYKRVSQTFTSERQAIRKISTYAEEAGREYFVAATSDQPFWKEGAGWTQAEELERRDELRKADGKAATVASQWPVYRTDRDGIGWVQDGRNLEESRGSLFNYAEFAIAERRDEKDAYLGQEVYESKERFLKVKVYNLAVDDNATFYVTHEGYWVRAANAKE